MTDLIEEARDEDLFPLILEDENLTTKEASDDLIERIVSSQIPHCITDRGVTIPNSSLKHLRGLSEEVRITRTDDFPVNDSIGIGYEIDEDTWNTLKGISEGKVYDGNELHIKWLSEAGLVVITDSGRIVLTEDAKTWISSTQ